MIWSFLIAGISAFAASAIVLSLATNVLSNAVWHVMLWLVPQASRSRRVNVRGFWVGRVYTREYPSKVSYNLWKITGGLGEISHRGEHYNDEISEILRGGGKGTFDPPCFAAYYRFHSERMNRNGAAVFKLTTIRGHERVLAGYFEQFADSTDLFAKRFHRDTRRERYVLVRVDIPLIPHRLRHMVGRPYFKDLKELRAFIDSLPVAKRSLLVSDPVDFGRDQFSVAVRPLQK